MERLTSFCKKAFSYPAQLRMTHPITAISVVATTVLSAIYALIEASRDFSSDSVALDNYFHICLAFFFFGIFAFCLESVRPKWSTGIKITVFTLFGLLSLFLSFINSSSWRTPSSRSTSVMASIRSYLGETTVAMYTFTLLAIAFLLAVYFAYSHDIDCRFNEHVFNANAKVFFSSIIYGVIQAGVLFLTIIVVLLLYDDAFRFLPAILIVINGLFFAPAILCALARKNENANMFFTVIIRYVMLIITMIAFAIIYIYMIKLIVTGSVPSNSVFEILAALFFVSMFISYECTVFEEKGFLQKFAYNTPLIFAPFILMQCYTVFVRISQYGLTPKRYFGLAIIAFEVTYILHYIIVRRKEHEIPGRNLLLIACSFLIITVFVPWLNARELSNTLCRYTLSSFLAKIDASANISDEEFMRANAAYGYLNDKSFGEGRLRKYFPDLDADSVYSLRENAKQAAANVSQKDRDPENDTYEYGWYNADLTALGESGAIDISGMDKMTFVRIGDKDATNSDIDKPLIDTKKLYMFASDGNGSDKPVTIAGIETLDLSDFCHKFNELCGQYDANMIEHDEYNDECQKISIIDINENARLYITSADISRNNLDECYSVNIEGFILYK